MPASKKPRKKYRPKKYDMKNPVEWVLSGFRTLALGEQTKLLLLAHESFKALTNGVGEQHDWRVVTDALNMAFALDELYFQSEYKDDIYQAQLAHAACGARFVKRQRFGYTGPELKTVQYALMVHEAQLTRSTVENIEEAVRQVRRQLERGEVIRVVEQEA